MIAAICVMALKLLVPAGYMPVPGAVAVKLCTGQGVETMLLDASGNPVEPRDHERVDATPCAYASLVAPILAAVDPLLLSVMLALIAALGWRALFDPPPVRRMVVRPLGQAPPHPVLI